MGMRGKTRIAWLGSLAACLMGLWGSGCEKINSVTPSIFLPPLAWCTPTPGTCANPLQGDLTGNITYEGDPTSPVAGDTTAGPNNYPWSGPDHVYSLTLCNTRRLTISTCGTSWDTVVMVLGGTCTGEVLNNPGLPEEDDGCGFASGPSRVSVVLPAGIYYVVVDGYGGASGPYTLTVTTPARPSF